MPKRTTKKQNELPGFEKPNHPELDTLLEEHAAQSSALGEARQRIGEINVQLEAKAKALGISNYRNDNAVPPLVLTITEGSTKVKVAKGKAKVDEATE